VAGAGGWAPGDLERWAAEARAGEAADARVRGRWLRQQAEEGAPFGALLLDLAEHGTPLVVTTVAGRRHLGRLSAVGADFVRIDGSGGRTTVVVTAALAAVAAAGDRPAPGDRVTGDRVTGDRVTGDRVTGDRVAASADRAEEPDLVAASLADVLAHIGAERPTVRVWAGGMDVTGELRAVGADVLSIEPEGGAPGPVYVRLLSVSEISFLGSG
jgi:hypothetical protein